MTDENVNEENRNYVFAAKTDNAKNVSQILKAIHFRDTAVMCISDNGLQITVEDSKSVQANAFIQQDIFYDYYLSNSSELDVLPDKESSVVFKINISVLLECLNIFGCSVLPGIKTTMKMCYPSYGSPLILYLEEAGMITDCSIKTMEADRVLDFNFATANIVNKIIMKSECLKEAWNELDTTSDVIELHLSPDKPYFRMSTFGNTGTIHVDYPKYMEMMELFDCKQTQVNRYKICLLKPSIKALNLSSKVSIRTDDRGFICLQYMIKTEENHICFVEYFCAPNEDDPEDID